MIIVENTVIPDVILSEKFSCNLSLCKGACCTLKGGKGAPLLDEEISEIDKALPFALRYLSDEHQCVIEKKGYLDGEFGNYSTACIDNRACVFVYYDGDIAKCSLERAYDDGKTEWKKPISCHLFPIRVNGTTPSILLYEKIPDCDAGRDEGSRNNFLLIDFLQEALERKFDKKWFDYLRSTAKQIRNTHK